MTCYSIKKYMQYMMGMRIFIFTVTLRADSSGSKAYFKGFLIEARNAGNLNEAVGSFRLVDPTISQLLQCNDKDVSNRVCPVIRNQMDV